MSIACRRPWTRRDPRSIVAREAARARSDFSNLSNDASLGCVFATSVAVTPRRRARCTPPRPGAGHVSPRQARAPGLEQSMQRRPRTHAARPPARAGTRGIRAWFMDPAMAGSVRTDSSSAATRILLLASSSGPALMTVTTPGVLRAEVEGLIWLGGGEFRRSAAMRWRYQDDPATHPRAPAP